MLEGGVGEGFKSRDIDTGSGRQFGFAYLVGVLDLAALVVISCGARLRKRSWVQDDDVVTCANPLCSTFFFV
jgi:hypothetical protein